MPPNSRNLFRARAIGDKRELSWTKRHRSFGSRTHAIFRDGWLSGRRLRISAQTFPFVAVIGEFIVLWAVVFEASALYHRLTFGHLPSPFFYGAAAAALSLLFVLRCALGRDHSIKRLLDPREQLRSAFLRWNAAYALWVFALFMLQATDFYSRGSIVAQYGAGLAAALLLRLLLARLVEHGLSSGLIGGHRTIVIGEQALLRPLAHRLSRSGRGASMIDTIAVDAGDGAEGIRMALSRTERLARQIPVDDIVLAFPWSKSEHIRELLEGLSTIPATIHLASDRTLAWVRNPVLARVGGHHTLRLARAPLTLKDHMIKRAFDVTVATCLLIAAAPLLAAIAIAIKLDTPGPVLFRQRRNGFNQREFRVFKFRTMTTLDDGRVIRQATRDDERITRVGRLLRRTNLDEVPQLFNVILGDMSLVGPRPHAVAHNDAYEEQIRLYARRHNVKPGITGWAQVNGYRGETDVIEKMQRRVEHDLYYIDHWSLAFDVKILLMTLLSPKSYRNAY